MDLNNITDIIFKNMEKIFNIGKILFVLLLIIGIIIGYSLGRKNVKIEKISPLEIEEGILDKEPTIAGEKLIPYIGENEEPKLVSYQNKIQNPILALSPIKEVKYEPDSYKAFKIPDYKVYYYTEEKNTNRKPEYYKGLK